MSLFVFAKLILPYQNPGIATIHQLALGFNMTIAEFCDFEAMNLYEFVEEENEVMG